MHLIDEAIGVLDQWKTNMKSWSAKEDEQWATLKDRLRKSSKGSPPASCRGVPWLSSELEKYLLNIGVEGLQFRLWHNHNQDISLDLTPGAYFDETSLPEAIEFAKQSKHKTMENSTLILMNVLSMVHTYRNVSP